MKTELQPIKAGVPEGSVLGPTLYVLYTSDLPTSTNTTLRTFADDTVILSVNETKTQEEQHPTFNTTLILYKLGLRSGV
jgi:hypothetical protein